MCKAKAMQGHAGGQPGSRPTGAARCHSHPVLPTEMVKLGATQGIKEVSGYHLVI